jgi:cytoskeletal protein RodZ
MTRDTSLLTQDQQTERLMQIGTYLRQVREENFLSLEEVAVRTLIQPRLLRAIETGKLQQLPEPVYIQGFIKRYAEALGLDGVEISEAFPVEGGTRPVKVSWNESAAAQLRPLHLYMAYIGLIVVSVSLLSYVVNRSTPIASTVTRPDTPSSVASGVDKPVVSSASPTAIATNSKPASAKPDPANPSVKIDVKLTDQSWLQVEVDGKTDYEGVLAEGTERSWSAKSQIRVRSGNAGGVMIAYNGKQAAPLGEPGAVEEKVFSVPQDSASLPGDGVAPIR